MSKSSASSGRVVRFGGFELDLHAAELRKAGARLSLPAQSFDVLTLLLERPGDLVTREELRQRLWPSGTFVDFEHGLNAVVNRLRDTLGDSADRPRFIETVPRRGYRFVGSVERPSPTVPVAVEPSPPPAAGLGRTTASVSSVRHLKVATAVAALVGLGVVAWLFWREDTASMLPPKVVRLTTLAGIEDWPTFSPDGQQVAFGWEGEKHDNADIYVTLVGSQAVRRVTTDPAADYAPSWSPDGRHIAFLRTTESGAYVHLTSALGGPDLKVSDFPVAIASRITWSPDGQYITAGRDPRASVGTSAGIYLIPVRGGEARGVTRPDPPTFDFSPAFSPDARRLAYASCAEFDLFAPKYYPTKCHVRVIDLDTNLRQAGAARILTPSSKDHLPFGSRMLDPSWTRDAKSVMFVSEVGPDVVHIWRVWVGGERASERIELAGSQALHPAMAASQDRLVFSRYDREHHLYQFKKGLPAEQIAPSSSFETDPHFLRTGTGLRLRRGGLDT
jgi:DNA-binding winged helix-turn-helix (wHTH) protein